MLNDLEAVPPAVDGITAFDQAHFATYLRLLDAQTAGLPWQTAAQTILRLDVAADTKRARRIWMAHLSRAQWMTRRGYRYLLNAND